MLAFISLAALSVLIPTLAAPTSVPISKHAGPVKANSYLIKLKDGVSKDAHLNSIIAKFVAGSSLEYKYGDVFHGYAVTLKGKDLDFVRQSKDVEFIEEDGIVTIDYEQGDASAVVARSEAPVVEQLNKRANGEGVDVYGVDTVRFSLKKLVVRLTIGANNRAFTPLITHLAGVLAGEQPMADMLTPTAMVTELVNTAATAVGNTYGVATSAKVIAVKVLSDGGSGAYSDIIAGVNWVVSSAKASGRPSIATLSLGGSANSALDNAIVSAINSGVHFTIAAGNSNVDAANTSPARVAAANTIGAVDSSNRKASFSNYGAVVDVWALGVNVLSAWIGSPSATNTISGTSMATPFVAGVLALAIGDYGNKTPAQLSADLKSHAQAVVTGAPSGTTNLLAKRW
ncbi:subtilisin-like serine protease [Ceratobasidium sp. 395]|nr:subtilisin-like serine protease [Ceratobasidium sp. 395]